MSGQLASGHFDLHSRALAALNNLTGNLDPNLGYEPYFWTIFNEEPVEARHDFCDFGDITGRYLDSTILVRRMTGAEDGDTEEAALKKLLLSYYSEGDGLSYRLEMPWSRHDALLFDQSRVLNALVTWLQDDGSPEAERRLKEHIDGLLRIAAREEGYLSFAWEAHPPHGWDPDYWPGHPFRIRPAESAYEGGVQISPLVRAYELMEYEPALELALGMAHWNRTYGGLYQEDGSFVFGHPRMATVAGIARLARVVGDRDLLAWARRAYDHAKTQGTRYGWVGGQEETATCESCSITDMIEAALLFAEDGQVECYGDVERMARNQLAEAQLLDPHRVPTAISLRISGGRCDTLQSSFDGVRDRVRGGFSGWSGPNEWHAQAGLAGYRMMACCNGAGPRALYFVWSRAVTREDGTVRVNLWLDRNTPWASVRSALPEDGLLQVIMQDDADLAVRIPDGVVADQISVTVGGSAATLAVEGGYIRLSDLKAGQTAEIRAPVPEYETTELAAGKEYRVRWRGDTVVGIDPPGEQVPLYQRGIASPQTSPSQLDGSAEPAGAFLWW